MALGTRMVKVLLLRFMSKLSFFSASVEHFMTAREGELAVWGTGTGKSEIVSCFTFHCAGQDQTSFKCYSASLGWDGASTEFKTDAWT